MAVTNRDLINSAMGGSQDPNQDDYQTAMGAGQFGGGTPTPTPLPDLPTGATLWADLADATTLYADSNRTQVAGGAGSPVLGVTDKSGNGNHLTGIATTRAVDGLTFDGAAAYMTADGAAPVFSGVNKPFSMLVAYVPATETANTPRTLFSAGRSSSTVSFTAWLSSSASGSILQRRANNTGAISTVTGDGSNNSGELSYGILVSDGTKVIAFIDRNGYNQQVDAPHSPNFAGIDANITTFTIGATRRDTLASYFRGTIREVVLYPRALDRTEIAALDSYARAKHYGETTKVRARLFGILGQSNAEGRGVAAQSVAVPAKRAFLIGASGAMTGATLADPVGQAQTGSAWPAFATDWASREAGVTFWVEQATGETILQPREASGSVSWDVVYGTGTLAGPARQALLNAHNRLLTSPRYAYEGAVRALWAQGEGDGQAIDGNTPSTILPSGFYNADAYRDGLVALRNYINAVVPVKAWWISELGAHKDGTNENGWSQVRAAQAQAAALIPNGAIVSTLAKGFRTQANPDLWFVDNTHYSQLGLNTLGADMSAKGFARLSAETA